jgi:hypothetical protein
MTDIETLVERLRGAYEVASNEIFKLTADLIERQQRELEELTESEDAYSDENAYLKRELEARDVRIAVLVAALKLADVCLSDDLYGSAHEAIRAVLQGNSGKGGL